MTTFILKPINEETAKVGNRVYSTNYGFGTIVEFHDINVELIYSVGVRFDLDEDSVDSYTMDGKFFRTDQQPTLFYVPPMLTKTFKVNIIEPFIKIKANAIETPL